MNFCYATDSEIPKSRTANKPPNIASTLFTCENDVTGGPQPLANQRVVFSQLILVAHDAVCGGRPRLLWVVIARPMTAAAAVTTWSVAVASTNYGDGLPSRDTHPPAGFYQSINHQSINHIRQWSISKKKNIDNKRRNKSIGNKSNSTQYSLENSIAKNTQTQNACGHIHRKSYR